MLPHQETLSFPTGSAGLHDITAEVARVVGRSGVAVGLCVVFLPHTSCSLLIQENADPSVRRDLVRWIAKICPEGPGYEHDDEGPDDMPAHLRAAMLRTSETVPVTGGRLALGTWQALYLW